VPTTHTIKGGGGGVALSHHATNLFT